MLPAKRITIGDMFVLIFSLLLFVFLAIRPLAAADGNYCILTVGDTKQVCSLTENRTIPVENGGYSLRVEICDGTAAIIASDCPDQVCVHTGRISKTGQAAACVPAGVILHITGDTGDEEDFRVG
ncbi:MAG: NusG domain II-containing protein [Clostridia bacterium]|nr:NusG domain II-containing protein [Clostridia bacterium]